MELHLWGEEFKNMFFQWVIKKLSRIIGITYINFYPNVFICEC
jgi:hypothetical protein